MKETLNFLTKEECAYFIDMIDKNHAPSSVVEGGDEISSYSETRTSSTCNLNHSEENPDTVVLETMDDFFRKRTFNQTQS